MILYVKQHMKINMGISEKIYETLVNKDRIIKWMRSI